MLKQRKFRVAKIFYNILNSNCYRSATWVNISNDGAKQVNETFNITVEFPASLFPAACYIIDFGKPLDSGSSCLFWGPPAECTYLYPGHSCQQSSLDLVTNGGKFVFYIEYNRIGRYTLTAKVKNRVSEANSFSILVATKGVCYLPKVDLKSNQKCISGIDCSDKYPGVLTHHKSENLTITADISLNCKSTRTSISDWQIRYYNESSQVWKSAVDELQAKYRVLFANGSDEFDSQFSALNARTLKIPHHVLQYGLYEFCLNVSMWDEDGIAMSHRI